jgi:hypothetical protein
VTDINQRTGLTGQCCIEACKQSRGRFATRL